MKHLLFLAIAGSAIVASAEPTSLQSPQYVGPPDAEHAATNRAFQGIPSMAVAPGGRLWGVWYAGVTPGEDQNNYVVLTTSSDGGATWSESLIIDPDGPGSARSYDPELWMSPDGRLFLFWAQMDKAAPDLKHGVWCMETTQPDSAKPAWSKPRRIADGVMMCKPLVLSSGEWALPVSLWREHDNSAQFVVSTDAAKTWTTRGACNVPKDARQFDEHMFIERRDGSLWLLVRTKYGIGESISTDHGKTWPELKPTNIPHPSSRFFVRRLSSGNLLLIKHGPLDRLTGRSEMMAFISKDDGHTWSGGLMLDERNGVSYPDGDQDASGLIRIIYDYSRTGDRTILMATFREEDAAAGKPTSDAVRLRQLVSKASGGHEKPKVPAAPVKDNADGEPLRTKTPGKLSLTGVKALPLAAGAVLFTDRHYTAAAIPDALKTMHFLPIAMNGEKTLTCERPGTVWFLTPTPDRNHDSQTKSLEAAGFKKVALPEVPLFTPNNGANYCTLYQKDCKAGEQLVIGKWAVPVFGE